MADEEKHTSMVVHGEGTTKPDRVEQATEIGKVWWRRFNYVWGVVFFGAFAIGGLVDRNYRLRFVNKNTLEIHVSEPIAAGTDDARIILPASALHDELRGRVVTRDGEPVEGDDR